MQPPQPIPTPIGSDPALVVSYDECLRYVKAQLNSFLHGDLKMWTEQHTPKISYHMTVGLKNDSLLREAPKLVQRLLAAFGMETVARQGYGEDGRPTYVFEFKSPDQLALFRQQLAQLPVGASERKRAKK